MASWLTLLLLARPMLATLRFPLTMPYVRPQLPQVTLCGTTSRGIVDVCLQVLVQGESYLCSGVAVDLSSELHITAFTPLASRDTVGHIPFCQIS